MKLLGITDTMNAYFSSAKAFLVGFWQSIQKVITLRKTLSTEKIDNLIQAKLRTIQTSPATSHERTFLHIELGINALFAKVDSLFRCSLKEADENAFTDAIKLHAEDVLKSPDLDSGRRALLEEMQKAPSVLVHDITRLSDLYIGTTKCNSKIRHKNCEETYDILEGMLRQYVYDMNPTLILPESLYELFYPLSQQFLAPVTMVQDSDLMPQNWASPKGSSTREDRYTLTGSTLNLATTLTCKFVKLDNFSLETTAVTTFCCNYDLATQKVSYSYSYTHGDKSIAWQCNSPFST